MTILLRDVLKDDLPIFFLHQSDRDSSLMAGFPSRDEEAFYKHWNENIFSNKNSVNKTIIFNGHVAGNILCWNQSGEWNIGYWIGKEFWNQGVATKALKEFLAMCPDGPLHSYVGKTNKASIRVLLKCGFKFHAHEADEEAFIMPSEINLIRKVYSAINQNDTKKALRNFDANAVRREFEGTPNAGVFKGMAELEKHFESGRSTWAEGACDPQEFIEKDDKVAVIVHVKVRLKEKTEWLEGYTADIFQFKDGKVIEFRTFAEKEKAFEWAGIKTT